jgi:hypothetical protein
MPLDPTGVKLHLSCFLGGCTSDLHPAEEWSSGGRAKAQFSTRVRCQLVSARVESIRPYRCWSGIGLFLPLYSRLSSNVECAKHMKRNVMRLTGF